MGIFANMENRHIYLRGLFINCNNANGFCNALAAINEEAAEEF